MNTRFLSHTKFLTSMTYQLKWFLKYFTHNMTFVIQCEWIGLRICIVEWLSRGRFRMGGSCPPHIEQYVYYSAVVHLSGFTVRSIILFTNAAILRINPPPPTPNAISLVPRPLCNCRSTWLRSDAEATLSYIPAGKKRQCGDLIMNN